MKVLTLKQPWAELIVRGNKKIEVRKWNTPYRGEFLIHSSKVPDNEAMKHFKFDKLPCGYIMGRVILDDVKKYENENEFLKDEKLHHADFKWGSYGFILKENKRIAEIPYPGQLGFWNFDGEIISANSINSPEEIKQISGYLRSLNLDYPDYLIWVKKCEAELLSGYKKGFYIKKDSQIVGIIIFQPDKKDKNILEIKHLSILQNFRNLGLGSLLLYSLEDSIRETSFKEIQIDAPEDDSLMIKFLVKHDFNIIRKDNLYTPAKRDIIFRKLNN